MGGLTIGAWVYQETNFGGQRGYIGKRDAYNVFAEWNSGQTNRTFINGTNYDSSTSVTMDTPAGRWVYVTTTYDSSTNIIKFYKDGVVYASYSGPGTAIANSTYDLWIGSSITLGQDFLDGSLDEVKIYNYARSPAQIIEDMNGGHPVGGSPVGSQVAYWAMDEMQGTTAKDSSINANHLTLSTASWNPIGKTNGAWNGTGANWLSRADDNDFDFAAADDFSISFWFRSNSATNPGATECIICKTNLVNVPGYSITVNTSGNIVFGIDDDTSYQPEDTATSTTDIYDATWHHIVARKTGTSRIDLFVDGRLNASKTTLVATGSLENSNTLYIGDRDGANNGDEFNGQLDEIKFYRAALTDEQVRIDMNAGASLNFGTTAASESASLIDGPGNPPVGYWKLDERTGTSAYDSSGNGYTGTLTNGPIWDTGKIGGGVYFDGADDYISMGDVAAFDVSDTADFSISAWFYRSSFDTHDYIVSKQSGSAGYRIYVTATDLVGFVLDDGPDAVAAFTTTTITTPGWHHVEGVWDQDSQTNSGIWLDGKKEDDFSGETISNIDDLTNTNNFKIGSYDGAGDEFHGKIDEVKFYNYARTPAQVAYDYNRGGPIGHWQLDECQGTTAYDGSGNGRNGTITIGAGGTQTAAGTCSTSSTAWGNGATGKFNSSLNFDGTDDYISVAAFTGQPTGSKPFTTAAWIKPTTHGRNAIICWGSASADQKNCLRLGTTGDGCSIYNKCLYHYFYGADVEKETDNLSGAWHHVAVTYSGTTRTLYLDGRSLGSDSYTPNVSSTTIYIGQNGSSGEWFSGQIDDARIYTYALSASQIQKLYNGGAAVRFGPSEGSP
jgi:hypothetical protein